MLRGNHLIILLAISVTIAAFAVQQSVYADITSTIATLTTTTTTTPVLDNTQESERLEQHHNQQDQLHPSLLVDTKYWIRNTEFGERDNWRDKIKPCTLLERIEFNEQSFISMGNSLDSLSGALESNLKELTLSMTGVLLLEEDTLNDQVDSMFFQYLNQSGDCFDSESNNHNNQEDKKKENNVYNERVFKFEPESDHMSWFNPENWRSELNEEEINDWIPDSHLIPCNEDIVVFGSRHTALNQILEANERAKTMSFKVNFRPSQATTVSGPSKVAFSADELLVDYAVDSKIDSLQVSKLLIGNTEYNQGEFQQLISSKQYENILFQFNDSESALKANGGSTYSTNSPLTLDESSVHSYFGYNICSDEAGCLCGNENINILKTICSFTYEIQPSEQPCLDPIFSSGYCSRICATVLIISMDPIKFKEKLLISTLNAVYTDNEQFNFAENVLSAPRRTSNSKYEITFRHVPSDTSDYEATLGIEREFAQLVYQKLNNDAWRSFFGIKSMSVRSSTQWRQSSYNLIFWPSFAVCSCLSIILWVFQESQNVRIDSGGNKSQKQNLINAINTIARIVIRFRHHESGETESILKHASPTPTNHPDGQLNSEPQIPLVSFIGAKYSATTDDDDDAYDD